MWKRVIGFNQKNEQSILRSRITSLDLCKRWTIDELTTTSVIMESNAFLYPLPSGPAIPSIPTLWLLAGWLGCPAIPSPAAIPSLAGCPALAGWHITWPQAPRWPSSSDVDVVGLQPRHPASRRESFLLRVTLSPLLGVSSWYPRISFCRAACWSASCI